MGVLIALLALVFVLSRAGGQDTPSDYTAFLTSVEKTGDFKDGVLKVHIRGTISA